VLDFVLFTLFICIVALENHYGFPLSQSVFLSFSSWQLGVFLCGAILCAMAQSFSFLSLCFLRVKWIQPIMVIKFMYQRKFFTDLCFWKVTLSFGDEIYVGKQTRRGPFHPVLVECCTRFPLCLLSADKPCAANIVCRPARHVTRLGVCCAPAMHTLSPLCLHPHTLASAW